MKNSAYQLAEQLIRTHDADALNEFTIKQFKSIAIKLLWCQARMREHRHTKQRDSLAALNKIKSLNAANVKMNRSLLKATRNPNFDHSS